jgi:predicted RND superfamily exporter protein
MYLSVLVLVPLMLSLTNSPVPDGADEAGDSRADRLFLRIADFSVRHPYRVFAVAILLAVWGAWEGRDVIVDNELTGMLDEDDPGVAANRRVDETLGGVLPVELALEGPEGSMRDPAVLRALYSVEAPAKEGAARTVVGPAGYVAALNEVLTGRREIPATAAGVAQVMMLGEGEELDRVMDLPASHARVTFLCKDWGASELIPWMDDLQARADAALAGTSVTARLTGTPFIAYRGINNVTSDLTPSLGTAFVVIALVFAGLTRSLRAGFLAMIPNALPLLVGYGFMGFMGWYLDPSPAVMFTVALGIASDDTVHVTMRAREEVRRGASMADAMRRTIFHSGRACTVTSLILSAGFSLNGFSSFPGLQVMGGLACAILLAAMVAEVFLTPALFVVFGKGLWARGKV